MLVSIKDLKQFVKKLDSELSQLPNTLEEVDLSSKQFKPLFRDLFKYFLNEPALSLFIVQLGTVGKVTKISNFYSNALPTSNNLPLIKDELKPIIKKEEEVIVFDPKLLPVLGSDVDAEISERNFDKGRFFLDRASLDQALEQLKERTGRKFIINKSNLASEKNKSTKIVMKCKKHRQNKSDAINLVDENPLGRFPLGVGCQAEITFRNYYNREYAFRIEESNIQHNDNCQPFPAYEFVDTDKVIQILSRRKLGYI